MLQYFILMNERNKDDILIYKISTYMSNIKKPYQV